MTRTSETWTVGKALQWTAGYFSEKGVDSPRLTAEVLLAKILSLTRTQLFLRFDQPLTAVELADFKNIIKRRASREPLAHITGEREFFSLPFSVSPDVLIPRPETEMLVETALSAMDSMKDLAPMSVLDLGTGSGAIICALAWERPGNAFTGLDRSEKALSVARKNAEKLGLGHIRLLASDWFSALPVGEKFHVIVSNPPYIPSRVIPTLSPEVCRHEPVSALDGGPDGLDAIRAIISRAPEFLHPGGCLIFEIGFDQKEAATALFTESGRFGEPEFVKDYAGHFRVAKARIKGQ
ncbi:MAG: peptide chain release factor N(5)-glutamine methyltransferase [Deltaproteobacteria bacterium]|nr:peptide chain release factor N(5)-glutamine methyltransferase [Deltaproteobacteria bacterium]